MDHTLFIYSIHLLKGIMKKAAINIHVHALVSFQISFLNT